MAVEFRTITSNEPLYVTYRLEPDMTIEEAAFLSRYRFSNLLGFYPWPDPAMGDVRYYSHLEDTSPIPGTVTLDGQVMETQRYVTDEIVVDVAFLANVSLAVARPHNTMDLPALTSEPYESLRPELPAADPPGYHAYHQQRPGGDFHGLIELSPDDDANRIEIRDEHGQLVQPPDGVFYSSAYTPLEPDSPAFDPSEDHSCVFCDDRDWQWVLEMRPVVPGAKVAWPPFFVACATCHRLYRAGLLDELRQRIAEAGDDWFLEAFDVVLTQILTSERRR